MTRIVAGTARGRRLAVPPHGTRPTSDRVREALFSSLDSELRDAGLAWSQVAVLDLYAGSGALGLEALSRSARSATLVERSRATARVLTANVDAVGCPGATVLIRDVGQLASTVPPGDPADLVMADPPYEVAAADLRAILSALRARQWIAPDAIVVVERPTRDKASPLPEDWPEPRRRAYGDTALWYGRSASGVAAAAGGQENS